jgi:molybdopterin-biosynthesis enzyme MoeA-like protein
MTTPTAAALIIGNELLSGRTQDANLNQIARRLNDVGIALREARFVRDEEAEIGRALNALREEYTYVFTTGGIGPTHDDITAASVAKAFGVPVLRNEEVVSMLKKTRGASITEAALTMADYPEGARLLPMQEGVPPGFYLGNVFVLAGVPHIMQVMLEGAVPLLQQGENFYTRSVDVIMGESQISQRFQAVQAQHPGLELGSYPFRAGSRYGTSLVVRGTDREDVDMAFQKVKGFLADIGAETR